MSSLYHLLNLEPEYFFRYAKHIKGLVVVGGFSTRGSAELFVPGQGSSDLPVKFPDDITWCSGASQMEDGRIFILDGWGSGSSYYIDLCTNTTTRGPSFDNAFFSSTRPCGGDVMMCGRQLKSGMAADTCMSLIDGKWIPSQQHMVTAREQNTLSPLIDGSFVTTGGAKSFTGGALSSVELLRDNWTEIAPLNTSRYQHAAVVMNNTVMVCGGHSNGQIAWKLKLKTCEILPAVDGQWQAGPSMNVGRQGHAMVMLDGVAYVLGGVDVKGVERLGNNGVWTKEETGLKRSRWDHCAAAVDVKCGEQ